MALLATESPKQLQGLLVLASEKASSKIVGWLNQRKRFARFGKILDGVLKDARQLLTGKNLVKGTFLGATA